jgi:hypothetical protein
MKKTPTTTAVGASISSLVGGRGTAVAHISPARALLALT